MRNLIRGPNTSIVGGCIVLGTLPQAHAIMQIRHRSGVPLSVESVGMITVGHAVCGNRLLHGNLGSLCVDALARDACPPKRHRSAKAFDVCVETIF